MLRRFRSAYAESNRASAAWCARPAQCSAARRHPDPKQRQRHDQEQGGDARRLSVRGQKRAAAAAAAARGKRWRLRRGRRERNLQAGGTNEARDIDAARHSVYGGLLLYVYRVPREPTVRAWYWVRLDA